LGFWLRKTRLLQQSFSLAWGKVTNPFHAQRKPLLQQLDLPQPKALISI
jgi:hypothetical protein